MDCNYIIYIFSCYILNTLFKSNTCYVKIFNVTFFKNFVTDKRNI